MKILISKGFGAGWSTWNSHEREWAMKMLVYQPIIDFIEEYGSFSGEAMEVMRPQMSEDITGNPDEHLCTLGAEDLVIVEVDEPFVVEEYDGAETVTTQSEWLKESFSLNDLTVAKSELFMAEGKGQK